MFSISNLVHQFEIRSWIWKTNSRIKNWTIFGKVKKLKFRNISSERKHFLKSQNKFWKVSIVFKICEHIFKSWFVFKFQTSYNFFINLKFQTFPKKHKQNFQTRLKKKDFAKVQRLFKILKYNTFFNFKFQIYARIVLCFFIVGWEVQ